MSSNILHVFDSSENMKSIFVYSPLLTFENPQTVYEEIPMPVPPSF